MTGVPKLVISGKIISPPPIRFVCLCDCNREKALCLVRPCPFIQRVLSPPSSTSPKLCSILHLVVTSEHSKWRQFSMENSAAGHQESYLFLDGSIARSLYIEKHSRPTLNSIAPQRFLRRDTLQEINIEN